MYTCILYFNSKKKVAIDQDVHVLFTLYEKAAFYGNVEIPANDVKSEGIYFFYNFNFIFT